MSNAVLSLKNITRVYEQGERKLTVLNQLNLDVRKGEIVALVGPSGPGKSTLLQIAGLLDTPTSGDVSINGVVVSSSPSVQHAPTPTLPLMGRGNDNMRTQVRRKYIGFVY